MKFVCIKVKSKKSFCALLILVLLLFLSSEFVSAISEQDINADTFSGRIEYLNNLGIFPDKESETVKNTVIPETFSAVYENYNDLQKSAGYDLSRYKGFDVSIYEYVWHNEKLPNDLYVHLIVFEKEIIGGDICDNRLNGAIYSLKEKI